MKIQFVGVLALACSTNNAFAFAPIWSTFSRGIKGLGNTNPPPPPSNTNALCFQDNEGDDFNNNNNIAGASILGLLSDDQDEESIEKELKQQDEMEIEDIVLETDAHNVSASTDGVRGGSTNTKSTNDIVANAKSSMQTTVVYWSDTLQSVQKKVKKIFKKDSQKEDEVDLTQIPVQAVQVTSEILPESIVKRAAQRSGMLGSALRSDRVNECARQLKKFYMQRGYVLHSVTGATLHSENGTATLKVQEPILSSTPIDIKFAKEVPIDPETGQTTTKRKYREKLERSKGRSLRKEEWISISDSLNTTLIEAKGKTNPHTLSKRMGLKAGRHFQWNGDRWQSIARSGIFSKIWSASPVQMGDGTVQLQVLCQESPPRNLEYGVSKSLYTGHWVSCIYISVFCREMVLCLFFLTNYRYPALQEGELDFRHDNFFGGGESLGIIVRRGAKDPEPSVTVRFSDDKFGMNGGYDAEVFRDYIAVDDESKSVASTTASPRTDDSEEDAESLTATPVVTTPIVEKEDALLCREGIKLSFRGPFSSNIVRRSSASALIERTSTRKGAHESIGSATLSLGPFIQGLPLGARASLATSATSGARVGDKRLLPYSSASVTSRQIFPLFTERIVTSSKQVNLALQHTLMGATCHFPRHEANAAGLIARVRGYSGASNGPIDSSIVGSAEIRIPITIPILKENLEQDGCLVFFGDWMYANHQIPGQFHGFSKDNLFGNRSVGVGLRKSVQGIPLKYDVSLTKDGRIGAVVSLGGDWEIH